MQSRYYNPEWGIFINADAILDTETGEKAFKKVIQTFINKTNELIYIKISEKEIITTPEHPFWILQRGWVNTAELCIGDNVVLQTGEVVGIDFIEHEILSKPVIVYNFEVEDFHTYYVSALGVLVHNSCGGMNNIRTLQTTMIKGYNVSMDLEKGGSGLNNIHLKVNGVKYLYTNGIFINGVGKQIPITLRNNFLINNALQKALKAIERGW